MNEMAVLIEEAWDGLSGQPGGVHGATRLAIDLLLCLRRVLLL